MSDPEEASDVHGYKDLPDGNPHYAAVGKIASKWAKLEWEVDSVIWELSGVTSDEHGACVTGQIGGLLPRLRALLSLCKHLQLPEDLIADLNKFTSDSPEVTTKRNRAVHDPLWVGVSTGEIVSLRLTADRKLDYRFRLQTMEEFAKIYGEVEKHYGRFRMLKKRIRAAKHLASLETLSR